MSLPLRRGVFLATCHNSYHCRTFFTLPNLSPLPILPGADEPETQTYHERKILPYRPSDLYKVVANVESYPTFLPCCTGSRVFNRAEQEDGTTLMDAEITVGFLAMQESYVSAVTCKPFRSVQAVASSPLFKTLNSVWKFRPASFDSPHLSKAPALSHTREPNLTGTAGSGVPCSDDGPTLVTLDIEFALVNPVHAAVFAKYFGQVSRLMVKAFEERCLAVYGPGTR